MSGDYETLCEEVNKQHFENQRLKRENAKLTAFIRSLLNPEELGLANGLWIRDGAREVLGLPRVETGGGT